MTWTWSTCNNDAFDGPAITLQKINQCGTGGGGGGIDFMFTGTVDPTSGAFTPPDPTKVNRYTNTVTGTEFVWPANAVEWRQVV